MIQETVFIKNYSRF